jgi:DNA polymerase V
MFALVDCNNFYVSCERVFNPKLNGRPVIVLSNNDGCAIARSEEAKAVGIEMGAPAHQIQDVIKKHNVAVYSSNYTLYGDMSERVHETLRTFAPRLESYSIDEAFLDLHGMKYHDLSALAAEIRATVKQNTGIPVSVGIAPTKTLAKMANRFAKKRKRDTGVHAAVSEAEIEDVLKFTGIGDVWGIGRQHETRLLQQGIRTAHDLLAMNDDWMRKNMTVVGQRLLNELRGMSCIPLEEKPPARKNICTARSFGRMVTDLEEIQEAVANYAANCGAKLRSQKSCARKVHVFLQTNPFRNQDPQYYQSITVPLPVATAATQELILYALQGINLIYRPGYNFMKAGVMVLDIIPDDQVQHGMFDQRDRDKDKRLSRAVDSVNMWLGRDFVRYAIQGKERTWKMRQANLSKCYTTRVNHVLTVKAN